MSKWKNITLYKFQQVDAINSTPQYDEIDKLGFSICAVFDLTEHQVSQMDAKKVNSYVARVQGIFQSDFTVLTPQRIGGYKMLYDVAAFTFGQYIELSFFFHAHIRNAHYALASASRPIFRKYSTEGHRNRADFFLSQPVEITVGALKLLMDSFQSFNGQYRNLFGLDKEAHDQSAPDDPFNKRYGWTYSAKVVAEYEGIALDQAYALPVRQALNDLAYLKEKVSYDFRQHKQLMKNYKTQSNG